MRHCACQCNDDGDVISMCNEHLQLADDREARERDRCARIVENLARMLGEPYTDPDPKYNTPEAIRIMHKSLAEIAAGAIRRPV